MSTRGFLSRSERNDPVQHYRRPAQRSGWRDPSTAPFDKSWRCQARDGVGPYTLPMLCIRTPKGWITATTRTPLHVVVNGWKYP